MSINTDINSWKWDIRKNLIPCVSVLKKKDGDKKYLFISYKTKNNEKVGIKIIHLKSSHSKNPKEKFISFLDMEKEGWYEYERVDIS